MKNVWKRGFALLFALVLVLSLSAPALADEPDPGEETPVAGETPVEEPPAEEPPAEEPPAEEPPAEEPPAEEPPAEEPGKEEPKDEPVRLFVSEKGNDEKGDGSEGAPFASLARAAAAANEAPERKVEIVLMTDLKARETARFYGRDVTLKAAAGVVTVTRQEKFYPAKDAAGVLYNPAMIELCVPKGEDQTAGTLTLIGVILDDAGRHASFIPELAPAVELGSEDPAPVPKEGPGEDTSAVQAPEDDKAKPADRTDVDQEAIVSVGTGGTLVLGAKAELRNFGGLSAVALGEKSCLRMEADSAILDTMPMDNELPAVIRPSSAKVELAKGARIVERVKPAAENEGEDAPAAEPSLPAEGLEVCSFVGPESITQPEEDEWPYPVDYTMTVSLSEALQSAVSNMGGSFTGSGTITITLDPRLTLNLSDCKLTSSVFQLTEGQPVLDGNVLTAAFQLKEGWTEHVTETTTFKCRAELSQENFTPSTKDKDEALETKGQFSLTLSPENYDSRTYTGEETTVSTRMLGANSVLLHYDVNGGVEGTGPEDEMISAQAEYTLAITPEPSHDPVDGVAVVFAGWMETKDTHIYETGETKPATVEKIQVDDQESITVYAVYSLDTNEDNVPDVEQVLVILSFDPNGGKNEPDPIIEVLTGSSVSIDIPEEEPTRELYSFIGWGKTPDATKDSTLYKYDSTRAARRAVSTSGDLTLYAVWQENYKIIYDANGGTNPPDPTILETQTQTGFDSKGNPTFTGQAVITSGVPTRTGFTFQGWAVTRRGAASYFAGNRVQISGGNVTLYAVWTRGSSGGKNGPKTGDEDVGAWAALLAVSAAGLAVTGSVLWKKRRGER